MESIRIWWLAPKGFVMNIKKIFLNFIVVLFAAGVFSSCVSLDYGKPSIDIPNAYVLDSYSISGRIKDRIRLMNSSLIIGAPETVGFRIYLHDHNENKWLNYGTGQLRRINDTAFVGSKIYEGRLHHYRYYAIEPTDGKKYSYKIAMRNDDLYIYVFD